MFDQTVETESGALINTEAEYSVLGALLIDPNPPVVLAAMQRLPNGKAFGHRKLGLIYDAILALVEKRMVIDPITLRDELRTRGDLDQVGGVDAVAQLADNVPTAANIGFHADLVRDFWLRRRFRDEAHRAVALASDRKIPLTAAIAEVVQGFVVASGSIAKEGLVRAKDRLWSVMESIEARTKQGTGMVGPSTGLARLDGLTGGFGKKELWIFAARPNVGKTSLALHAAAAVAEQDVGDVLVFSLEMAKEKLLERLLATVSGVPFERIHRGRLRDEDFTKLAHTAGVIASWQILLDEKALTPGDIRLVCEAHRAESGRPIALIVVDYIQRMRSDIETDNPVEEMKFISRGLKDIANNLDTTVLALSQLNRASATTNRAPELYDLRQSGDIEQDADTVLMLHYAWVDPSDLKPDQKSWGSKDKVEGYLRKQRNGPQGEFDVLFDRERQQWRDVP